LIGPLIGSWVFFGSHVEKLAHVQYVYWVIAAVVLLVAFLVRITPMPEPLQGTDERLTGGKGLLDPGFIRAVLAQGCYVGAQVGIAAYFINYATEGEAAMDNASAAYWLSFAFALFTAGRFASSFLMRRFAPARMLTLYALINTSLCCWVAVDRQWFSVYLLTAVFFFESLMFPTIFALGIEGMGQRTKTASSVLVMSIVGGAILPYVMGYIAEQTTTATAFLLPSLCFLVVAWFGGTRISGSKA
jgi:FHS family L-fucose permease-like MFS transporter